MQSDIVQPNSGPLGPATRRYHSADRTAKAKSSTIEKVSSAVPEAVESGTRSGEKVVASWESRYIFMSSATTLLPGMSPARSDLELRGWQQPAPQSETEPLETPATAMAGTTPARIIPTPLDLSVVAGPVPPARAAKNPLKPVVLKGTALDNLRRLGGPSSSVSSFESRGSASATKSSIGEPGGPGAGRGVCGDGVSAIGGQILRIDESTALDGVIMDSRRTPAIGATAGVRAAAEVTFSTMFYTSSFMRDFFTLVHIDDTSAVLRLLALNVLFSPAVGDFYGATFFGGVFPAPCLCGSSVVYPERSCVRGWCDGVFYCLAAKQCCVMFQRELKALVRTIMFLLFCNGCLTPSTASFLVDVDVTASGIFRASILLVFISPLTFLLF